MSNLAFLLVLPVAVPQLEDPEPVLYGTQPLALIDNYVAGLAADCAGAPEDSHCDETQVGIYYPDGAGPPSMGYAVEPRPVFVILRGANQNPGVPNELGFMAGTILPKGFIGVDPSYPEVGEVPDDVVHGDPWGYIGVNPDGEDYNVSVAGVARLVQYLRAHSEWLNVDPDKIFVFGRSFGGVVAMAVGLKDDFQDLASADPVEHESSRPNGVLSFSGPMTMDCSPGYSSYNVLMQLYFPVSSLPESTLQEKLDDSAWYWLAHPELYGRTTTPPMYLGYDLGYLLPCGELTDPHDGQSGIVMKGALDDFVATTGDVGLGTRSVLVNSPDHYGMFPITWDFISDWALQAIDGPAASLYLYPDEGQLTTGGEVTNFRVEGADPGSQVFYFLGFTPGNLAVLGCPGLQSGLFDFYFLGLDTATPEGRANLGLFVPPGLPSPVAFFVQAYDFGGCRKTNLQTMFL